jgi:PfaD family protein
MVAKVSRPEVAERFLSPSPRELLRDLVAGGQLSRQEAELAERVPVADDVTVESDSGGHTDNRPLGALLPVIQALRERLVRQYGYRRPIHVGAAGGLGVPAAVAAAFAAGADYVVTGSVNQLSVESDLSQSAKTLLGQAGPADVAMAPAADMFELGIKVQVLRRGTMFAPRASRLYELYRGYPSLDALPDRERSWLEREIFRRPLDEVWAETRAFWATRDPAQAQRAQRDPQHRMALVFRWYLGMSSGWAARGEAGRLTDYQIWCGPAIGAFNRWVLGSPLAVPERRTVVQIALNLLEGAAAVTRAHQLRTYGVAVPDEAFRHRPRLLS